MIEPMWKPNVHSYTVNTVNVKCMLYPGGNLNETKWSISSSENAD